MNCEDFYDAYFEKMKYTEKALLDMVSRYSAAKREKEGIKPIVYCCSRIKTPESMLKKLAARDYEQTLDAAVNDVYDGVGVRVVCAFAEDVYRFVNWIKKQPSVQITEEKDYCELYERDVSLWVENDAGEEEFDDSEEFDSLLETEEE